jgi:asparagine synthase (glutamine-hydrolysing)
MTARIRDAGFRVAVSGVGADEIFSGYYDHHLAYLYERYRDTPAHRVALAAWERSVLPYVRNPLLRNPDLFVGDPAFRGHLNYRAEEFSARLRVPWKEAFMEDAITSDLLRNRMLNELLHESVPVLLHEEDLNSMYHSVEQRAPFLDRELVEFCARIPTPHLIQDGLAKAVLRDAVADVLPPRVVESSRKLGFNLPVSSLLDVSSPGVRAELLDDSPVFEWVERNQIRELLDRGSELENSDSKFLFSFISCKLFVEQVAGGWISAKVS